jgi:hypothetical protein
LLRQGANTQLTPLFRKKTTERRFIFIPQIHISIHNLMCR